LHKRFLPRLHKPRCDSADSHLNSSSIVLGSFSCAPTSLCSCCPTLAIPLLISTEVMARCSSLEEPNRENATAALAEATSTGGGSEVSAVSDGEAHALSGGRPGDYAD
jgi:hypothetical protein